ncbi:MAG: hypothetical protein A2275_17185 [Bacteroidetes bacterium RIFOXYA12_FULL_35_11]|nr:MAG: hypothetical protein A2X01_06550 [Bacteroidetes bacterium GWF2_35_48]OFY79742.1 MAG: hypothetical protein A2275_17185 [Bacteroidetes bacterium RIFOXYA12_FULL_35_11]
MKKEIAFLLIMFLIAAKSYTQVNVNDSLALVDIYDNMNGTNWPNSSNWLTGNVSTWYGITVQNHRVIRFIAGSNKILGTLPSSIENLTDLRTLVLISNTSSYYENHIGPLPPEIGNLQNLDTLRIEYCYVPGEIPQTIGNLTNLKVLNLSNNNLTGSIPASIGNLVNLKYLNLSVNNITGFIPVEIENLMNIKYLQLGVNLLTGTIPSELGSLNNLKELGLAGNQLTGIIPPQIGNIDSLELFSVLNNQIIKYIPSEFCNCTKLKWLVLSNNQMSGTIPPCLGLKPEITIGLDNNHFSGAIPETFASNNYYQTVSAYNNDLDSMPDFSAFCQTPIKGIDVRSNKMTFEDFEMQACFVHPIYWPQDSVHCPIDTMITINTQASFTAQVGGTANYYSWRKNGAAYTSNASGELNFSNFTAADTGVYTCTITNPIVPNLTLYRYPIHIGLDTNGVGIPYTQKEEFEFSIAPNPVNSSAVIKTQIPKRIRNYELGITNWELQITNSLGVLVKTYQLSYDVTEISVTDFSSGIYSVQLKANGHVLQTKKMVVVR